MLDYGWGRALALLAAVALAGCGGGDGDGGGDGQPAGPVGLTVMTWNVLHGGRFEQVTSGSLVEIPAALDAVWAGMEASQPRTRMRTVAAQIAALRPDVAGLQEAALWRSEPRDGGAGVEYDLVALVLAELTARGADYAVVATASAIDVALPGASAVYRFTDRDVVLARAGLQTSNPRGGTFDARLPIPFPVPGGGASTGVPRAWTSVDVELQGRSFRFVSTHLETVSAVSALQAAEVVEKAGSELPVVLVGDFNSAPGDPAYEVLVSSATGYGDAWEAGAGAGLTCCRETLEDPSAGVTQRVDLVLQRGFTARSAALVGADAASFQDGRWPSDHVGVVATLELAQ
jgi:endonuclease/exonuclease/phosphatase family metal-dependent hydrolase